MHASIAATRSEVRGSCGTPARARPRSPRTAARRPCARTRRASRTCGCGTSAFTTAPPGGARSTVARRLDVAGGRRRTGRSRRLTRPPAVDREEARARALRDAPEVGASERASALPGRHRDRGPAPARVGKRSASARASARTSSEAFDASESVPERGPEARRAGREQRREPRLDVEVRARAEDHRALRGARRARARRGARRSGERTRRAARAPRARRRTRRAT